METLKKVIAWIRAKLKAALTAVLKVTTNPAVWVQWCHFSIAYSAVIGTYFFFGPVWLTCVLGVPAAIYKECWIDPHDEHGGAVGKPDWDDLAFYMAGMVFGLLLLRFAHHR